MGKKRKKTNNNKILNKIEQNDNTIYKKELEEKEQKEQRRNNRQGIILSIFAVIGTVVAIIFRVAIKILSIWTENQKIYKYFQVVIVIIFAMVLVLVIDTAFYIVNEMKRNNLLDYDYEIYDKSSDTAYKQLMEDFGFYFYIVLFLLICFIPIAAIGENIKTLAAGIFCVFSYIVCLLVLAIIKLKKEGIKKLLKEKLVGVIRCAGASLVIFLICYSFIYSSMVNSVRIEFAQDGNIVVNSTSMSNYNGMDIKIYDKDNDVVFYKNIEEQEIMFAKEYKEMNVKVNSTEDYDDKLTENELLHWKYSLNLNELNLCSNDEYVIHIVVYSNQKNVNFLNTFNFSNKIYTYTTDVMQKEY